MTVEGENESNTMDKCHADSHLQEIRILVFVVSWEPLFNIGTVRLTVAILEVMFIY